MRAGLGLAINQPLWVGGQFARAFSALANEDAGFVFDPISDAVVIKEAGVYTFVDTMAAALADGILNYPSPSTKYVRNSAGVFVPGTTLRCHYGASGVALGLLSEPQRTNLLLNSASLATQSVTVSATAYTLSFEGTGTVTLSGASTAGPLVGTGATDRVSLTFTPSAGTLTLTVSGTVAYSNLEAGLFRTSPIVTAGSTVTRNADNLYVDLAKVPFTAAAYTIIAHAQPSPDTVLNGHFLVSVNDATSNNRAEIVNSTAGTANLTGRWRYLNNTTQAQITTADGSAAAAFKCAIAGQADDFEFVVNGVSAGTDNAGSMPLSPTGLQIGRAFTSGLNWSAPIGFLAMIPERLSQADMIARTTL